MSMHLGCGSVPDNIVLKDARDETIFFGEINVTYTSFLNFAELVLNNHPCDMFSAYIKAMKNFEIAEGWNRGNFKKIVINFKWTNWKIEEHNEPIIGVEGTNYILSECDFIGALDYVLTNSDLTENDVRLKFLKKYGDFS